MLARKVSPSMLLQDTHVTAGPVDEKSRAGSTTPEDDPSGAGSAWRKRGVPRNALSPVGRAKRARGIDPGTLDSTTAEDDKLGRDEDIDWRHVVELLQDREFKPGQRPDQIMDQHIRPGLMFKEHPKRRREHSTLTRPMDKWYNTGGIKSASDRFLNGSDVGLRKRYGKVVREGLSVLRFHEYKLLERDSNGEVLEAKLGPALYRLVPESKRRQDGPRQPEAARVATASSPSDVVEQKKQLQMQALEMERLRQATCKLERQLAAAKRRIAKQARQLSHFSAAATLLGPGSILDGASDDDSDEDDQELEPTISGSLAQAVIGPATGQHWQRSSLRHADFAFEGQARAQAQAQIGRHDAAQTLATL